MKAGWGMALVLGGCLMAGPGVFAQNSGNSAGQSKPDKKAKKGAESAQQTAPQAAQPADPNAFPTDTSNVPVMPSTNGPDAAAGGYGDAGSGAASLPGDDLDPVRSPDQAGDDTNNVQEMESTSNVKALDSLLPGPGDDSTGKRRGKDDALQGPPKETSKEDITVGKYYMDQRNWKAALSRFQSALVLAPEDPEVYWGLAESARHLGNFADARGYYQKVTEYDPDSKHAKEAQKALKDPEIANAKAEK